ncbi:hypothetical protein PFMALIP_03874 [Plasmodium falciparum MaliPS096_E11]|nr:hypothetical protein PFMALIP_03874 [Plasmodium falciparum MaliPS096_E11]
MNAHADKNVAYVNPLNNNIDINSKKENNLLLANYKNSYLNNTNSGSNTFSNCGQRVNQLKCLNTYNNKLNEELLNEELLNEKYVNNEDLKDDLKNLINIDFINDIDMEYEEKHSYNNETFLRTSNSSLLQRHTYPKNFPSPNENTLLTVVSSTSNNGNINKMREYQTNYDKLPYNNVMNCDEQNYMMNFNQTNNDNNNDNNNNNMFHDDFPHTNLQLNSSNNNKLLHLSSFNSSTPTNGAIVIDDFNYYQDDKFNVHNNNKKILYTNYYNSCEMPSPNSNMKNNQNTTFNMDATINDNYTHMENIKHNNNNSININNNNNNNNSLYRSTLNPKNFLNDLTLNNNYTNYDDNFKDIKKNDEKMRDYNIIKVNDEDNKNFLSYPFHASSHIDTDQNFTNSYVNFF